MANISRLSSCLMRHRVAFAPLLSGEDVESIRADVDARCLMLVSPSAAARHKVVTGVATTYAKIEECATLTTRKARVWSYGKGRRSLCCLYADVTTGVLDAEVAGVVESTRTLLVLEDVGCRPVEGSLLALIESVRRGRGWVLCSSHASPLESILHLRTALDVMFAGDGTPGETAARMVSDAKQECGVPLHVAADDLMSRLTDDEGMERLVLRPGEEGKAWRVAADMHRVLTVSVPRTFVPSSMDDMRRKVDAFVAEHGDDEHTMMALILLMPKAATLFAGDILLLVEVAARWLPFVCDCVAMLRTKDTSRIDLFLPDVDLSAYIMSRAGVAAYTVAHLPSPPRRPPAPLSSPLLHLTVSMDDALRWDRPEWALGEDAPARAWFAVVNSQAPSSAAFAEARAMYHLCNAARLRPMREEDAEGPKARAVVPIMIALRAEGLRVCTVLRSHEAVEEMRRLCFGRDVVCMTLTEWRNGGRAWVERGREVAKEAVIFASPGCVEEEEGGEGVVLCTLYGSVAYGGAAERDLHRGLRAGMSVYDFESLHMCLGYGPSACPTPPPTPFLPPSLVDGSAFFDPRWMRCEFALRMARDMLQVCEGTRAGVAAFLRRWYDGEQEGEVACAEEISRRQVEFTRLSTPPGFLSTTVLLPELRVVPSSSLRDPQWYSKTFNISRPRRLGVKGVLLRAEWMFAGDA